MVLDHLVLDVIRPALGLVLLHADLPLAVDAVTLPVLGPGRSNVNHDGVVGAVVVVQVVVVVGDGVVVGVAEGTDKLHATVGANL